MVKRVVVVCAECKAELEAGSPDLRVELTDDDEPVVYCAEYHEREFGDSD